MYAQIVKIVSSEIQRTASAFILFKRVSKIGTHFDTLRLLKTSVIAIQFYNPGPCGEVVLTYLSEGYICVHVRERDRFYLKK